MREIAFADFITLQRGFDLPRSQRTEGEYPVIGAAEYQGTHSEAKVSGPIVTTGRSGTIGEVLFTNGPGWPLNTCLWVKDFKGNNPYYVYCVLKTLALGQYNSGAGVPTLNRNHLDAIRLRIHRPDQQIQIAATLSAYDDLIENNTRRIAILEEMARRIFEEWFVHFRAPGCEGLPTVDSPLGPIPKGWPLRTLSDFAATQYGYTTSSSESTNGPKFLRGMDLNKRSYIDWSAVPYCAEPPTDVDRYRLKRGDIVVVRMADPGKIGIVEQDVDAVLASYLVRLDFDHKVLPPQFVFHMLTEQRYQQYVLGASNGTTRKSIPAPVMTSYQFALPPSALLSAFTRTVDPIRGLLSNLVKRNANLRAQRDLLLPKLISGEIDVSVAAPLQQAAE